MIRTNADDFRTGGLALKEAWAILDDNCSVPPSFEVFQYELGRYAGVSPQELARQIARHHRTQPGLGPR